MATANRLYGRVLRGNHIPYGTLANASYELKQAYYYHGYPKDTDFPELPVLEPAEVEVDPEEVAARAELGRIIAEILDGLMTPREAKVLRMRFGIDLSTDYTLEEVGQVFDVTRERIRQIEAKALRKLRNPLRQPLLRQWVDDGQFVDTKDQRRMEAIVKYYQHRAERGW